MSLKPSSIFNYAKFGHIEPLKLLLDHNTELMYAVDDHGWNLLFWACILRKNEAMFEFLLARGVKWDVVDVAGNSALHIACRYGNMSLAKRLVELGASVSKKNRLGLTALDMVLSEGCVIEMSESGNHLGLEELLAKEDPEETVNKRDDDGWTGLHFAAANGHVKVVEVLLARDASPKLKDCNGKTALHLSARFANDEVTRLLLRAGAKINAQTRKSKFTPIHYACKYNKLETAILLIESGANVLLLDAENKSALHYVEDKEDRIMLSNLFELLLKERDQDDLEVFSTSANVEEEDLEPFYINHKLQLEGGNKDGAAGSLSPLTYFSESYRAYGDTFGSMDEDEQSSKLAAQISHRLPFPQHSPKSPRKASSSPSSPLSKAFGGGGREERRKKIAEKEHEKEAKDEEQDEQAVYGASELQFAPFCMVIQEAVEPLAKAKRSTSPIRIERRENANHFDDKFSAVSRSTPSRSPPRSSAAATADGNGGGGGTTASSQVSKSMTSIRPHSPIMRQAFGRENGGGTPRSRRPVTLTAAKDFSFAPSPISSPSKTSQFANWIDELSLSDYYEKFIDEGFRLISDFDGLKREDLSKLFPFLKMGDLMRLAKNIQQREEVKQINEELARQYK